MVGRHCAVSGETCTRGDACRSQSLHSTVAAAVAKSVESKATPREGRQEGGCVKSSNRQYLSYASPVPRRGRDFMELNSVRTGIQNSLILLINIA